MSDQKFEWTDQLVRELYKEWFDSGHNISSFGDCLEAFKATHQPKSREFEVLELRTNEGYAKTNWRFGKASPFDVDKINFNVDSIFKVRRTSDGEVFTVGDQTTDGKIMKMYLINGILCIGCETLDNQRITGIKNICHLAKPVRKPLFVSNDGVDIFADDTVWHVFNDLTPVGNAGFNRRWEPVRAKEHSKYNCGGDHYKVFSSEKAASEYILLNKPCLSVNDVKNISWFCPIGSTKDVHAFNLKNLEQLAKEKIKW